MYNMADPERRGGDPPYPIFGGQKALSTYFYAMIVRPIFGSPNVEKDLMTLDYLPVLSL